jgi:hypothetical protein
MSIHDDVPGAGPAPVDYDTVINHPVQFHRLPITYILQMVHMARQQHPYKVVGEPDTYSDYNQGWEDAANLIEELIIEAGLFQMRDLSEIIGLPMSETRPLAHSLLLTAYPKFA